MEEIFALLFKFSPFFFSEGTFAFLGPLASWQFLLVTGALFGGILFLYRGVVTKLGRRGFLLLALKLLFALLVVVLLMRPTLTISTMVPQQSILALLVDNSKSMGILENGSPRGEPLKSLLADDGRFLEQLRDNFNLRLVKFDSDVYNLAGGDELSWTGEQTNISMGINRVLAETKNLPLGGIILFSDGSDNSYQEDPQVLDQLASKKIPLHTVGVGADQLNSDVEITQVSLPNRVLPGSVATARVTLKHSGFSGARAILEVREGTTLIETKEVYLSPAAQLSTTELKLFPETEGIREYDFRVKGLEGEEIEENNSRRTFVNVIDKRPKILLVEGRPRWEYKFLRQALAGDEHLRLEALLRTALNKFYRQGIEEESTLASGFPSNREDLFEYEGVLLGDVESAFFTYAQMEAIRDFVSRRGGGLLMMGGRFALSQGGYSNTPVEEAIPVQLGQFGSGAYQREFVAPLLTQFGENHPALQLAQDDDENRRIWLDLPELTDTSLIKGVKAGATILAQVVPGDEAGGEPLLVAQRFGRGLGLVFLSGSSWRWQMLKDHEDQSHETFWRQVLRWLVSSARDPVSVEVAREVYAQNEPVRIRAEVSDETFNRINQARVTARVYTPTGKTETVSLRWYAREDGVYTNEWIPQEDGLHRIEVSATSAGDDEAEKTFGAAETHFLTLTGQAEYFDAAQKKSYLQSLAEGAGGRYYDLSTVSRLPEEVVYTESHSSVTEILELWNMPINFLLLVGLLGAEWILRRRWGLS